MSIFIYLAALAAVLLLNIANDLLFHFSFFPNLTLVFFLYTALASGRNYGQLAGFLLGMLYDCFSPLPFGATALSWTVIGFLVGRYRKHIENDNFIAQIVLVFAVEVLYSLSAAGLNGLFGELPIDHLNFRNAVRAVIDAAIFTLVFGLAGPRHRPAF